MTPDLRAQCIAFAGLCQSALLVHRAAHGLTTSSTEMDPLIHGIFETTPDSIDAVYGAGETLRSGAAMALEMLSKPTGDTVAAMKYVMTLLDIEARLRRRNDLAQRLRAGIDQLRAAYASQDASLLTSLSTLYQSTISTLDRRVHVTGSPEILQRGEVAAKIRTLLLAGIRSAWLWHQSGGRRWHLLLRRSAMRNTLKTLAIARTLH